MKAISEIVVLIPVYQPEDCFLGYVKSLLGKFSNVIVVDDGSTRGLGVFAELERLGTVVVRHHENRGKGAALKTGFRTVLRQFPSATGVVTADADGQHSKDDVVRVARALLSGCPEIVLGIRCFCGDEPLRSRFGNRWIRTLLFLATGVMVSDAQTGLRGIPMALLPRLLGIPGDRYEYEMRMLADVVEPSALPVEIRIQTIYSEGNASSHFRPVVDSLRICSVLVRFAVSGLVACLTDNVVYVTMLYLLSDAGLSLQVKVLVSIAAARLVSMNLNYYFNSRGVFGVRPRLRTYLRYWLLALFFAAVSYWGIVLLAYVLAVDGLRLVVLKILLEVALFAVSFVVQRRFFRKKEPM